VSPEYPGDAPRIERHLARSAGGYPKAGWTSSPIEWDAFAIPDSRMSWRLQGIQLLEHRLARTPGEPPDSRTYGPVVRVSHPDQLSWTAEKLEAARYLIDLVPA
jgi:hypothetical protein